MPESLEETAQTHPAQRAVTKESVPSTDKPSDDFDAWMSSRYVPGGFEIPDYVALDGAASHQWQSSDGGSETVSLPAMTRSVRDSEAASPPIAAPHTDETLATTIPTGGTNWYRWFGTPQAHSVTSTAKQNAWTAPTHVPLSTVPPPSDCGHPTDTTFPPYTTPMTSTTGPTTRTAGLTWWEKATGAWNDLKSAPRRYMTATIDGTVEDCTTRIKSRLRDDISAVQSAMGTGAKIGAALTLGCLALNVVASTAIRVCDAYEAVRGARRKCERDGWNGWEGWSAVPAVAPWGSPYVEHRKVTELGGTSGWDSQALLGAGAGVRGLLTGAQGERSP